MRASRISSRTTGSAATLAALLFVHGACWSSADPARGEDVFKAECAECHSARKGKSKKGPSMFGVAGRRAAVVEGEVYSDALRATGWVWDEERLRAYLSRPVSQSNPGGKMKYEGLRDAKAMDDLLAYLQTLK